MHLKAQGNYCLARVFHRTRMINGDCALRPIIHEARSTFPACVASQVLLDLAVAAEPWIHHQVGLGKGQILVNPSLDIFARFLLQARIAPCFAVCGPLRLCPFGLDLLFASPRLPPTAGSSLACMRHLGTCLLSLLTSIRYSYM